MVDADTADKHHLKLGDDIGVISAVGTHHARISGIADFQVTNPGAAIFYLDTKTAQRTLVGEPGVYTNVNVTAASGVTDARLKTNVAAELGGAYKVQTAKETADANQKDVEGFMNVMKYAMLGFAGIAFLVGIFLIINTFSMLVAQRTREIGLMRAVGSSRGQVNRSVLAEALLLGVFGSVLGVGAGVGLAVGLMKLMGSMGMHLSTSDLTVAWTTPVVGLLLGVVVTVLAAWLPARRAGKVSPMAALRDAGAPADARAGVVRGVLGGLLTMRRRLRALPGRVRRQGQGRLPVARPRRGALPDRLRRDRPAAGRWRGARPGRDRAQGVRSGRPHGRAQRPAQPAPYRSHRRRPDDRPRAGRLPLGGRLLHGRLGHRPARQDRRHGLHHPVRQRAAGHMRPR